MTIDAPLADERELVAPEPPPAGVPGPPAPAPRHRRWQDPNVLGVLVLVLAVAAFAIWWFLVRSTGSSSAAATPTDQVVAATSGDLSRTVSATGTVAAAQQASLSFGSAGTVTAVNVKAGDTVTTGEVLATIDPVQLQAAVSSAQSGVASAEAKLSDDRAAGASSTQISADDASLTSANDALTSAQSDLAGASLVATFDGTVASVNLSAGEQLGSGGNGATTATGSGSGSGQSSSSLGSGSGNGFGGNNNSSSSSTANGQIELVSSGHYTVSLGVGSSDIAQVAAGQSATLTVTNAVTNRGFGGFARLFGGGGATNGGGNGNGGNGNGGNGNGGNGTQNGGGATGATATGTVTDVGRVATASSGVASYPVTITFDAPATQFFVGATVTGAIDVATVHNAVQVPSRAVTTDTNGRSTVQVATDGTAGGARQTRVVTTGLVTGGETQIVSGLRAGESVVIAAPTFPGFAGNRTGTGGTGFPGGFGGFGGGDRAGTGGAAP
jgi:multidrug efflux pump subunit AcrA (membrane-fusion protein)